MNRFTACLFSYVAAWWMKFLAIVFALTCVLAVVLIDGSSPSYEPAWGKPEIYDWYYVDGIQAPPDSPFNRGRKSRISLADVEGVNVENWYDPRFEPSEAPYLRYFRLTADRPVPTAMIPQRVSDATDLVASIRGSRTIDSVEVTGMLDPSVLEPLRGSRTVRRLLTSNLIISGGENRSDPEEQMASLLRTVASLPNLEVWGPPREWYLINEVDSSLVESIRNHQSLKTLLSFPDEHQLPHQSMFHALKDVWPGKIIKSSLIDATRVSVFAVVFVGAVVLANLIVMSLADMLATSQAAMVPRYCESHRTVAVGLLLVIACVAATCLYRSNVALPAAALVSTFAVLLTGLILEIDRRNVVSGGIVMPMCFAPIVAMAVSQSLRNHGHRWLWLDELLRGVAPVAELMLLGVVCVACVVFWRSVPRYAASLTASGRTTAVGTSRRDIQRRFALGSEKSDGKVAWGWQSGTIQASPNLTRDTLPAPDTLQSRMQLIRDGLFHIPPKKLAVQFLIVVIVYPTILRLFGGEVFEDPRGLAGIGGVMLLVFLWMGPFILWNDRVARIPNEIGTLLPRRVYVDTLRAVLRRQWMLPSVLTAIVATVAVVWTSKIWWTFLPALVAVYAAYLIAVSVMELGMTMRTSALKFLACFGIAYLGVGLCIGSVMSLTKIHTGASLAMLAVGVTIAVSVRIWMNRRLPAFEFGRLG